MVCSAFALSSQVFCCALLSHEITFHEGHSFFFAIYLASRCRSPVLKSQCAAILYRVRLLRREGYGKETVKTPETFAQSISFAQFSHQPSLIPAHVGYFLMMISMFFFLFHLIIFFSTKSKLTPKQKLHRQQGLRLIPYNHYLTATNFHILLTTIQFLQEFE